MPLAMLQDMFVRFPLPPGQDAYANIDGRHMHQFVVEQANISRKYRDAGHPKFWGRIIGTSADAEDVEWMIAKFRAAGLSDVRSQPYDLVPQWFPESWEATVTGDGKAVALDVWWATSDIGWIVGHSYMVYAPLLVGCTTIAFEGALDYPQPDANWRAAVEEFGVSGIFTSPTAVRMLMRYGNEPLLSIDHSRLERIVCAGEVLNAPAWDWLQNTILGGRVPVIDHMWQTETSGPVFGNPYGLGMLPIKPGSAAIPLPGIESAVVSLDGTPCATGEKGIMVLKRPFPGLTAGLWGEPDRYGRDYWQRIPGMYYSGDGAHLDEDGYVWFAGRADEIIKIAGHRIGTIEVESACLKHPAVAECAVVGRPDDVRGEVISAFVLLKHGHTASADLHKAVIDTVRRELGPVAVIGELNFVGMLPKTRSGKLMRRVLRAVILDRDPGDITTIEDEGSVDEARQAWMDMKSEVQGRKSKPNA